MKKITYIIILTLLISNYTTAQKVTSHIPWTKEDSAAINALALYPDSVRMEIFQACEYPAIIVNVASLQKNSSAAFAELAGGYSQSEQGDIWNLSRYPNLIAQMVQGSKKSQNDLESILANYSPDIHDIALKYYGNDYDLLEKINDLQTQTDQQFQQIISSYPADVQKVFTDLLQLPEVMGLLNDHLSLAVRVGDHYKRDPQWVIHKSDSNALAQARANTQQFQDWEQTLQQDSNAQNELTSAANEYAQNNGYDTNQTDEPVTDSNEVNDYFVTPYSYWFGYPSWYPYDYWYPYPYWYDWGFYYGRHRRIHIFGFPSYYFINWYFSNPKHWHRYPHLGSAYIHHYYYGSGRINTLSRLVVHNWVQDNRKYLPAHFIRNASNRPAAIKQLGSLSVKAMNKQGVIDTKKRDQYFAKNNSKFSALNHNPAVPKVPEEKQVPEVRQNYVPQPAVYPQKSQPKVSTPTYNYNNLQRAQSYHSGGWQQAQPVYNTPAPQPRQAPVRSMPSQPMRSAPSQPARSMPSAPARSGGVRR